MRMDVRGVGMRVCGRAGVSMRVSLSACGGACVRCPAFDVKYRGHRTMRIRDHRVFAPSHNADKRSRDHRVFALNELPSRRSVNVLSVGL